MAALVRLVVLAVIVAVVFYLVNRLVHLVPKGQQVRALNAPICPKCESFRRVVPNAGDNPRYPRRPFAWYCQGCEEGF